MASRVTRFLPRRVADVVVVGLNYAPEATGIAPYTTALARSLAEEGLRVTAITGMPHYPEWRRRPGFGGTQDDEAVDLTRVFHPVPRRPNGAARILMELAFAVQVALRLPLCRAPVVVCVSPALLSAVPALAMRHLKGWRVGLIVQDLYGAGLAEAGIAGARAAGVAARLEGHLLGQADGISVIHEVFQSYLVERGVDLSRVRIIPNWSHVSIPDVSRAEARRLLGWPDDEIIALHAGNMGAKQGLEVLVDVARAAERAGSRIRIALMGDGSRRRALERYAAGATRLTFLDSLPAGEFETALVAADVLLLNEKPGVLNMSVPSKLTSYFVAGRPVVAATAVASGAAELVRRSGAGRVVSPGDPLAILTAVEQIADDEERAAAYGVRGRQFADEALGGRPSLLAYREWIAELADDTARRAGPA
jgi:glycosyltransferase involved in cell wall biosynthesis